MITQYRHRILTQVEQIGRVLGVSQALDFGCGDGFFASHLARLPNMQRVIPVDVVARPQSLVKAQLYDGTRLPFDDNSFDLVYAIDVLHHCSDPLHAIADMARCSGRYLLIKDHTYDTRFGYWALAVLDELGNRRFGIPSPGLYQHRWEWVEYIEARGWKRLMVQYPLACHSGLLGTFTNSLQWLGLWERSKV